MTSILAYYSGLTLIQRRKLVGGILVACVGIISPIVGFIQQHRGLGIASGFCGLFVTVITAWYLIKLHQDRVRLSLIHFGAG
ncbi:hypothetical protein JAAARDRAFT_637444 [Jaapia argillacea MUCL 33604]|uniref:Uncharacterized protein n=1 Tax=Jaapia argillacea MUCL 33604 TaxID=933084 RepID=A0A067PZ44_9AGAM|nr:hypothetical protein JAAARDRAFT_637444 [Jaapia argillacea MUCL 33604]